MKRKTLINSMLVLISVLIPIRFEYLEYLRYVPSNYYYLKFYFPYFVSILILIVVLIRILKNQKDLKLSDNIIPTLILIFGIYSIFIIRDKTIIINDNMITHENGLSYNSFNHELLNGTYKEPSKWDGFGNDVHCSKMKFINGVKTGKWMYSHKGDLIHSGEYIDAHQLKLEITNLSKCSRVDINNWKEGNYPYMDINLINPSKTDSLTVKNIVDLSIENLKTNYQFKTIAVSEIKNDTIHQLTHLYLEK